MMSNDFKGRFARVRLGLLPALFAGIVMVGAAPRPADALTIVPHYEGNLTAGDQGVIQNAINSYQATFTDPITVDIEFHFDAAVFGQSFFPVYSVGYGAYKAALIADAKTADDATAIASLGPGAAVDPAHGNANISIKPANGRAVGLATGRSPSASSCPAGAGFTVEPLTAVSVSASIPRIPTCSPSSSTRSTRFSAWAPACRGTEQSSATASSPRTCSAGRAPA